MKKITDWLFRLPDVAFIAVMAILFVGSMFATEKLMDAGYYVTVIVIIIVVIGAAIKVKNETKKYDDDSTS